MGLLRGAEYITVDRDGFIRLTETGRAAAESVYERHRLLTDVYKRQVRPAAARTQRTVGGRLHALSSPVPIFSRDSVPYFLHLWYNIP